MISAAVILIVTWAGYGTQWHRMPDLSACLHARTQIEAAARDQLGFDQKELKAWCEAPEHPELVS